MIISLIGFMGCGKSSVGKRLSELLCCPFMDLDDVIEASAGRSIPEIFASDGEAAFRQMELDTLYCLLEEYGPRSLHTLPIDRDQSDASEAVTMLALGGGTVMTKECAELIKKHTCCIYLKASVDTLVSHLEGESAGRPILQADPNGVISSEVEKSSLRFRIETLMATRSATYEETAHIIIDTDGKTIETVAQDIMQTIVVRTSERIIRAGIKRF